MKWDGRLPSQRSAAAAESAPPGAEAQLGRPPWAAVGSSWSPRYGDEGSYGMLGVVWSHVNVESNESSS